MKFAQSHHPNLKLEFGKANLNKSTDRRLTPLSAEPHCYWRSKSGYLSQAAGDHAMEFPPPGTHSEGVENSELRTSCLESEPRFIQTQLSTGLDQAPPLADPARLWISYCLRYQEAAGRHDQACSLRSET